MRYNKKMEPISWLSQNWTGLVQTVGMIGALLFTGLALVLDVRSRRAGNLIRLTDRHRELWERMSADPHLARILDPDADLEKKPLTAEEELFAIFVVLHLSDNYFFIKAGFFEQPRGLRKDIRMFFSLPIPRAVWMKVRELQDAHFLKFVEQCWVDGDYFHK